MAAVEHLPWQVDPASGTHHYQDKSYGEWIDDLVSMFSVHNMNDDQLNNAQSEFANSATAPNLDTQLPDTTWNDYVRQHWSTPSLTKTNEIEDLPDDDCGVFF